MPAAVDFRLRGNDERGTTMKDVRARREGRSCFHAVVHYESGLADSVQIAHSAMNDRPRAKPKSWQAEVLTSEGATLSVLTSAVSGSALPETAFMAERGLRSGLRSALCATGRGWM